MVEPVSILVTLVLVSFWLQLTSAIMVAVKLIRKLGINGAHEETMQAMAAPRLLRGEMATQVRGAGLILFGLSAVVATVIALGIGVS